MHKLCRPTSWTVITHVHTWWVNKRIIEIKMNAVIMIYVDVYVNTVVCKIPCHWQWHWGATGCWMHDRNLSKRGWFDQESYLTVFCRRPMGCARSLCTPWIRLWWRESQATDSQPLEVVDHLDVHVCVWGGTSVILNVGLQLAGTFWDFISRCNRREIQFLHIGKSVGLNPASEGIWAAL